MSHSKLLLPFVLALPLAAQGLLITPEPQPRDPNAAQTVPQPQPAQRQWGQPIVRILRTQVSAEIVDGVATTTIEQTYRNDGGRDAEGTWFLPLPAGAVADGFTMTVGGKEVAGEVLDANQARGVYERIVRQRRDPGLLEYAGEGMLRARIYPIPANGEVGVKVRMRQVLQPTGGLYEWRWPLRAAQFGDTGDGPLGLSVKIRSQTPLSTVIAPYAAAEIRRNGELEAIVSLEGTSRQLEDLKVLYGLSEQEFGLHMLPWREAGNPGYFTMLLSPPRQLAAQKAPRRCVQFVVDTSGSMSGDKIEQAKAALRSFLTSLRGEDTFQVITFASNVQKFFESPQRATPENLEAAKKRIEQLTAMGGTNIGEALREALESQIPVPDADGTWLPQIVFLTDGQPTVGLTNPQQILELTKLVDKREMRVFALGVGDEIDVRLLDDLVLQHRGARDFVRNKEKIEVKVDALCQKIAQPALTDVEVRCEGLDAYEVHPTRTRDLFCGEMLQVVGRYRNSGRQTVHVRGKQAGVEKDFVFQVDFPELADQHSFVPTLWARQHVASLLDDIRRNGQRPELIIEVRKLATRYGIVTPYTSQLIVEEGMRLAGNDYYLGAPARETAFDSNQWSSATGLGSGRVAGAPGGSTAKAAETPPADVAGGAFGAGRAGGPAGPTTGGPAGPGAPARNAVRAAPDGMATLQTLGSARTGAAAVEESLATTSGSFFELFREDRGAAAKDAERKSKNQGLVRQAAGRAFVVIGEELIEQGLPADWNKTAVVIETFSDAYFALLKQSPKLRDVLALGERIVFRDGERIVHVKPADPKPAETKVETKTADPAPVAPKAGEPPVIK
jgi:Ca-activated chloride channel family protein